MPVEFDGAVVLRVNGERAHAKHVGDLERAPERIEQQSGANAAPLRLGMNSKPREHQQRDRMARHTFHDAFGSGGVLNLARDDRVEADDLVATYSKVGLRRVSLLSLQRVAPEEAIELRLAAGEWLDCVSAMQLFDAKRRRHGSLLGSNTEGS